MYPLTIYLLLYIRVKSNLHITITSVTLFCVCVYFSFTSNIYAFIQFCHAVYHIFYFDLKNSLTFFCKAEVVWQTPSFLFSCLLCVLSFTLFFSILFLNNFFQVKCSYFILSFSFFFPLAFSNMSFHSLLAYKVSVEKSTQSSWKVGRSYICKLFFFLLSNFSCLWLFDNLIMCLGVVSLVCSYLRPFINLDVYFLIRFQEFSVITF